MDPSNTIERDPKSFGRQPDSDLQQRLCRYQGIASRLAALRRRLVEAERLQPTEIKPGGGQHRHLARQHHRRLLEQQREPAARARPRRPDALDPMVGAVGARHIGRDGAVAQWRWKKFRRRQVKLAKSWALHDRPQSGHGNSAPRSAATSICGSLGRLSVSSRWPTSLQGGAIPSPRVSTSLASIDHPSVAAFELRRGMQSHAQNLNQFHLERRGATLRCLIEASAIHTLIRQRPPTPSCGGSKPLPRSEQ